MTCQCQVGLLVMRECGQPSTGLCGVCGRMICADHSMPGPRGAACPSCASQNDGYEERDDAEIAESRQEYVQRYGRATGYGQQNYFTPADSAALGAGAGVLKPAKKPYNPRES